MVALSKSGNSNVTLVAFYGNASPKALEFQNFITHLQNLIQHRLLGAFTALPVRQIHATFLGVEGIVENGKIFNRNYMDLRGEKKSMHIKSFLKWLKNTKRLPIEILFGGIDEAKSYPFNSQGEHLYERSIILKDSKVILIGWPIHNGVYSKSLGNMRRFANRYNILHKYHATSDLVDNDFYLVIGHIDQNQLNQEQQNNIEKEAREYMERHSFRLTLKKEDLSLISYTDSNLPITGKHSSRQFTIEEAQKDTDVVFNPNVV